MACDLSTPKSSGQDPPDRTATSAAPHRAAAGHAHATTRPQHRDRGRSTPTRRGRRPRPPHPAASAGTRTRSPAHAPACAVGRACRDGVARRPAGRRSCPQPQPPPSITARAPLDCPRRDQTLRPELPERQALSHRPQGLIVAPDRRPVSVGQPAAAPPDAVLAKPVGALRGERSGVMAPVPAFRQSSDPRRVPAVVRPPGPAPGGASVLPDDQRTLSTHGSRR